MPSKEKKAQAIIAYGIWPLLVAVFVSAKAIFLPGCAPFDLSDDAMHTFVNLFSAQAILAKGQWPLVNVMNNFGTPLIGDALTYPFALHSQTYWLLPFDLAMGVNRFVLAFLTMVVLTAYFSRYMRLFSASVGAITVMFAPGFIWHFAHHHYQAALLWCAVILIFQERFNRDFRAWDAVGLYAGCVLLFFNTSVNLAMIVYAFVAMNQLVLGRFRMGYPTWGVFALMLAGALASWPDIVYFLTAAKSSVRFGQSYGEGPHYYVTTKIAIAAPGLAVGGLVYWWKERRYWQVWRCLVMGILPIIIINLLIANQELMARVPFVRSTDITRVWWVSNIFLVLGMGKALDTFLDQRRSIRWLLIGAVVLIAVELCFRVIFKTMGLYSFRGWLFGGILGSLAAGTVLVWRRPWAMGHRQRGRLWAFYGIGLVIIAFQVVFAAVRVMEYSLWTVCRRNGHYFSPKGTDRFEPRRLLRHMRPFSRVAVEEASGNGRELKIIRDHMVTSAGRSVFLNEKFFQTLSREGLVTVDQETPLAYHFSAPWDAARLRDLGVRYLVVRHQDPSLRRDHWQLLGEEDGWRLYENPKPTGLAYVVDANGSLVPLDENRVALEGNNVRIQLTDMSVSGQLVATFVALPGWRVYTNHQAASLEEDPHHFLRVSVSPQTRIVEFVFQPFSRGVFWGCWWGSLALLILTVILGRRRSMRVCVSASV